MILQDHCVMTSLSHMKMPQRMRRPDEDKEHQDDRHVGKEGNVGVDHPASVAPAKAMWIR